MWFNLNDDKGKWCRECCCVSTPFLGVSDSVPTGRNWDWGFCQYRKQRFDKLELGGFTPAAQTDGNAKCKVDSLMPGTTCGAWEQPSATAPSGPRCREEQKYALSNRSQSCSTGAVDFIPAAQTSVCLRLQFAKWNQLNACRLFRVLLTWKGGLGASLWAVDRKKAD